MADSTDTYWLLRELVDSMNREAVLVHPQAPPQAVSSWRLRGEQRRGKAAQP